MFDLGFLADGAKIFSLKDETANFLLDKSQVDYFFSQCSASRETEHLQEGAICKLAVHASSPNPTAQAQRRDQKWWVSLVVTNKSFEADCLSPNPSCALPGSVALGSHWLPVPLCPRGCKGANTDSATCIAEGSCDLPR